MRDVLVDDTLAEEDLSVDGMPGWPAVLVLPLGLEFPGGIPPGAGETDVGDELNPGITVPVPRTRTGAGITVPVGPEFVTVYTIVPVTTVSVAV